MTMPTYGRGMIELTPNLTGGFATGLASALGPVGTAAAGVFAASFGAALAAGGVLAAIGGTFDDAFDEIRVGTGATGDVLDGLKEDFKGVFADVPTDSASAATAIADLNTRLGLTGDELEARAGQFLELSRITGADLSGSIESATRVFGDWGVAVEDQEGSLDAMFRASQATGISVDELGRQLVTYGAPLRQLGFGFEQSAAMIGQFEKEGVNAELVMGSMRIALGKMARDGEDAETTFQRVTDEIANAGSTSEANALALELFGARAGPDMAAAIREGRFEVSGLMDTIANGTETIRGAADDTKDWRESWTLLKNRVLVGLEPLATRVFGALGDAMERLLPIVDTVIGWFSNFGDETGKLGGIFGTLGEIVMTVFEGLQEFWEDWGDTILGVLSAVWNTIVTVVQAALDVIKGILDVVLGILTGDWSRAWEGIKTIFRGVWDAIKGILSGAWDIIKTIFSGAISAVSETLTNWFRNVVDWFKELPGRIVSALGNLGSLLVDAGKNVVRGLWNGIKSMGSWLVSQLTGWVADKIPGPIARALGISSPSKVTAALGEAVAEGLVVGMFDGERMVERAAEALASSSVPSLSPSQAHAINSATGRVGVRGFDQPGVNGGITVNAVVHNPTGEPTEESLGRALVPTLTPYLNR